MTAYYNEFDPYAAAWLRNLITAGHIADGVVDTRSIEDVSPGDLAGFTQCHFFAGVGVWSYALRSAGWEDDRPVWTGSCPCQPFSAAGQGAGFADERHLWPAFGHLIAQCKPAIVLGEQVASKDVDVWIDLVHADLEALGYAFGSVPFPSAGIGAPHIRDRNYWVANAGGGRLDGRPQAGGRKTRPGAGPANSSAAIRLAHASGARLQEQRGQRDESARSAAADISCGLAHADGGDASAERQQRGGQQRQQPKDGGARGLADAIVQQRSGGQSGISVEHAASGRIEGAAAPTGLCSDLRPGPTNGFWRDADWLGCTDGKWRPVEPGTFPLAHGATSRVGRLRAYGNAVNAEAARAWVEVVMESTC